MNAGRELDKVIAQEVMEFPLSQQKREWFEATPKGTRPLRPYSSDMKSAWEVVEKLGITVIPIEGAQWFALVGPKSAWASPAEFIQYLGTGKFAEAGAAVGENAPHVICLAAIRALEQRRAGLQTDTETVHH